jgi:hypothetical protein
MSEGDDRWSWYEPEGRSYRYRVLLGRVEHCLTRAEALRLHRELGLALDEGYVAEVPRGDGDDP